MSTQLKDRTETEWMQLLRAGGVKVATATEWAEVFHYVFTRRGFSQGEKDLLDFLATVIVESQGLTKLKENGYYSAARIRELGTASPVGSRWRSMVPRANELAGNPDKFFEACYGGRMGNGPEGTGDGARYCGRGLIMLTGKAGYAKWGAKIGQDLLGLPGLAEEKHFALDLSISWWEGSVPDEYLGNTLAVRKAVNGGTFGVKEVAAVKEMLLKAGL